MSYQSAPRLTVVPVKDVNPDLWNIEAPSKNPVTNQQEMKITYNGEVPILQFGSTDQNELGGRFRLPFGASRWDPRDRKYKTVSDQQDTECMVGVQRRGNNPLTGKLLGNMSLYGWDQQGSHGYHAYQAIRSLEDAILDVMVNGLKNPKKPEERTPLFSFAMTYDLAKKAMFKSPLRIQEPTTDSTTGQLIQYPPDLKIKFRWKEQQGGNGIYLDVQTIDGETGRPESDAFKLINKGCMGVWMIRVNPLIYKASGDINISLDCFKAMVWPKSDVRAEVQFVTGDGGVVTGQPLDPTAMDFQPGQQ